MNDDVVTWEDSPQWRFSESFPRPGYTLQVYAVEGRPRDWMWAIHLPDARIGTRGFAVDQTFRSRAEAQRECERQYRLLLHGRLREERASDE